jgi:preprotein translocase subunit SecE
MAMNLNREQKRAMRKMGSLNENDAPTRADRSSAPARRKVERTPPRQFLREVRAELRKVAWPSREEVKNYSIVVLVAVLVFTAVVAGLDYGFGKLALWLFNRG